MENKNNYLKEAHDKLFKNESNNYIFIYTPPKVGSTTLMTSFRISLGKSFNIIHIHDEVMLNVLTGINNITIIDLIHFIAQQNKNIFVIDVYRSPIERKISEYFEQIAMLHFNNTDDNITTYNMQKISDRFNNLFPHLANGDHYFEKYCLENKIPFDFNKKYTMQRINNVKYIKLRIKDSHNWASILSEIIGQKIVIVNDYQSSNKKIGELYNRFKQEYKLPTNFLNLIKDCKYFNFYYSEEERKDYLKLWQNKTCSDFNSYTKEEYLFYVKISLENQYYNVIQLDHYIDNGCFCKACSIKRRELYFKAIKGENITEKIIHNKSVNDLNDKINENNIKKANIINELNKKISNKIKNKKKKNKIDFVTK